MPHDSITITSITELKKTTFSFLNSGSKRTKKAVEHNRSNTILDSLQLNNPLELTTNPSFSTLCELEKI